MDTDRQCLGTMSVDYEIWFCILDKLKLTDASELWNAIKDYVSSKSY